MEQSSWNRPAGKCALAAHKLPKIARVVTMRALHTACVCLTLLFGVGVSAASAASADPPYEDCDQARADGRSSIPFTDPAYQPELDLDGDGLACEPSKAHRSRR
jgi:hypothetical protein